MIFNTFINITVLHFHLVAKHAASRRHFQHGYVTFGAIVSLVMNCLGYVEVFPFDNSENFPYHEYVVKNTKLVINSPLIIMPRYLCKGNFIPTVYWITNPGAE
jgi:hypothetical protein